MEKKVGFIFTFFSMFCIASASAQEIRPLYRSGRVMAMGGVFTAFAEGKDATFLNPAGLASDNPPKVHYLNLELELATDILGSYQASSDLFQGFSLSGLNALLGENIYARAQYAPVITMNGLGIGLISDGQAAFYAKNQTYPDITIGYQTTNGIQLSFGTRVSGKRPRPGRPEVRLGAGFKVLWRRGGYKRFSLLELTNVTEGTALLREVADNFGIGYGLDLGSQFIYPLSRRSQLRFGASFTEIGDVAFAANNTDAQQGNMSVGVGYEFESDFFDFRIGLDYQNMLESLDWRLRSHFGMEAAFPFVSLYAGINQTYLTYGAKLDAIFFTVSAYSYAQELGALAFQEANRRYIISLDFSISL